MASVGILGLGIIGSRIAEHVAAAGYELSVWSHSPRERADFCTRPRAVAQQAAFIQIFVRDDAALLAAVRDMQPVLTSSHVVINHATVSPAATAEAAALVQAEGAGFLDAPFTGSKMAAQNGRLVYYVGGDEALLEKARPVLEASSSKIMHVGGIGTGTVLKIATNAITAVTVKGLAEAYALTRAAGVSGESLLAALEPNANFSALIGMKLPAMIRGDYEPHFSALNMLKDADFALAMAQAAGLETPALQQTAEALRSKVNAGFGAADFSVVGG